MKENFSLYRLTKDGEKPHNLEMSDVRLTIICPDLKCQANESVPINIESIDHDIIQELCINEEASTVQNVHDNYFNDFDNYVINSTINGSVDDRNNSLDSCFEGLSKDDYFLGVNNIQKVDFCNNNDFCVNNTDASLNQNDSNIEESNQVSDEENNGDVENNNEENEDFTDCNDSKAQNDSIALESSMNSG